MPRRRSWDKHGIKAEIHRRGETLRSLELLHELPANTLTVALARPSPRGEDVIAIFLNVPLNELWPDRYDEEGLPIRYANSNSRIELKQQREFRLGRIQALEAINA